MERTNLLCIIPGGISKLDRPYIEKGSKMTDKAVAMIAGNFPLDDNIIAGRFPYNACQAGKTAAC